LLLGEVYALTASYIRISIVKQIEGDSLKIDKFSVVLLLDDNVQNGT
jgi:hypothetical protein